MRTIDHRRPRPRATAPAIDVQRLGRAVRGPGVDTRIWYSAGTVGYYDDRGKFVTGDGMDDAGRTAARDAIACEEDGILVDVRLEPSGHIVAARYHGVSLGRFGGILIPIQPGEEVTVAIPNGDLNSSAIHVVALAANATAKIPSDWGNDRILIQAFIGPIEMRAPAIAISSNNLTLNGRRVVGSSEPI